MQLSRYWRQLLDHPATNETYVLLLWVESGAKENEAKIPTKDYNSNGLYLALEFLYKAALITYRDQTIDGIIEIFQQITQMLGEAGVSNHAENVRAKADVLLQLSRGSSAVYNRGEASSGYLLANTQIDDMESMVKSYPFSEKISCSYF